MVKLLTAQYGVENIVKSFGGAKALSGVSLSVKGGEVHCIAGENGSGKSTLIKIMSGVHAPDSGVIQLGDKTFTHLSPREAVREGVQVIFQDFSNSVGGLLFLYLMNVNYWWKKVRIQIICWSSGPTIYASMQI